MQLEQITPVILTFDEAPNIARTLRSLAWARQVVVVDSGSTDETLAILEGFDRVTVVDRPFDDVASQRNHGLEHVATEWAMCMDADHFVPEETVDALRDTEPGQHQVLQFRFRYAVHGKLIRGSILPPRPMVFRTAGGHFVADGHCERLVHHGPTLALDHVIVHDDRKPLQRWFQAQSRYAPLEANKLLTSERLNGPDRIRKLMVIAPVAVPLWCLLRGGLLSGWRGFYYAMQRGIAESILALALLENRFTAGRDSDRH